MAITFGCWKYAHVSGGNRGPGIPSLLPHRQPICMLSRPVSREASGESSNPFLIYSFQVFVFQQVRGLFRQSHVRSTSYKTTMNYLREKEFTTRIQKAKLAIHFRSRDKFKDVFCGTECLSMTHRGYHPQPER